MGHFAGDDCLTGVHLSIFSRILKAHSVLCLLSQKQHSHHIYQPRFFTARSGTSRDVRRWNSQLGISCVSGACLRAHLSALRRWHWPTSAIQQGFLRRWAQGLGDTLTFPVASVIGHISGSSHMEQLRIRKTPSAVLLGWHRRPLIMPVFFL